MRLFIWLTLVALVAAMVAGCNRIGQSAGNVAKGNSNTPATGTAPDNVRRVTISELRDDLDKGKAIVIDVRGDTAYNQEHIKGALNISEGQIVSRMGELPKDKLVVLYCS